MSDATSWNAGVFMVLHHIIRAKAHR
jgi:hypothetical protein